MATYSAYKYNSSNNLMYRLDFVVNEIIPLSAEDIANNVSRVNWELNLYSFNNYAFSYHTLYWYIAIAGLEIEPNGYLYPAALSANSSITIASGTATIPHQTDGSKLAYCYAKLSTSSGSYMPGTMEATGNLKLTDVPRTSSVSCNSFNIGDATTIVISRASDSFTHTLTWAFGNASGTIATKTSATTVGATIPASSLYAQIPNSKSGVGTITCQTYSGDNLIGTSTCSFTAYAKESECIPTVSASIADTNDTTIALTGSDTKFIKGFSNAKVTISATAKNSASISSYLTSCGDGRTSSTAITQFNNINSKYISVKATDSRGYPKSVDYTLDWIEYIRLAFTSITVKRPESTADKANMTIKGNYFNNTFGNISNSLILQYRYKEGTGEYTDWTTLTPTITENTFTYTELLENLDHNKEYTFEFMIDDQLMTVYSDPVVLTKGIPVLRVGKDYVDISGILKENGNNVITEKEFEKNIITAGLKDGLPCDILGSYTQVTGFMQMSKSGNKLTLNNDNIVIGAGVKKIKVSAKITWYVTTGSIKYLWLYKNNIDGLAWSTISVQDTTYISDTFPEFTVDVKEGDIINMMYYTDKAGDELENLMRTYITVEVVE